jgi:hypothetical protein
MGRAGVQTLPCALRLEACYPETGHSCISESSLNRQPNRRVGDVRIFLCDAGEARNLCGSTLMLSILFAERPLPSGKQHYQVRDRKFRSRARFPFHRGLTLKNPVHNVILAKWGFRRLWLCQRQAVSWLCSGIEAVELFTHSIDCGDFFRLEHGSPPHIGFLNDPTQHVA